jgi:hypothetical protein
MDFAIRQHHVALANCAVDPFDFAQGRIFQLDDIGLIEGATKRIFARLILPCKIRK